MWKCARRALVAVVGLSVATWVNAASGHPLDSLFMLALVPFALLFVGLPDES